MLPTTCRRLLLNGLATALLLGCQPSDPLLDQDDSLLPSYPRVGGEPPLQPELNQATLPDFGSINDVASKKAAFFGFLRPLVEHQNQHMQRLREHILTLEQAFKEQGGLHPDDQRWLNDTAELFRVDSADPAEQLKRLRRKVGRIPTAMVLAQAANESAWGTSRFARQGNNLFGMWCFKPGCGLEPLQRSEGATHEVAAYRSVEEGIYRYLINLNANSSYRDLRGIRQCLRREERPLTGRAMTAGLTGYSERGSH
ncbi:MAG TPA: glucosaminidase domain-containing protein, partial [Motiliproteus sp.]